MIGDSATQDLGWPPLDPRALMGAERLYRQDVRAPYTLVPMNLRAANKPSETNVVNATGKVIVPQQAPPPQSTGFGKVLSHYIFLPKVGLTTFGNT